MAVILMYKSWSVGLFLSRFLTSVSTFDLFSMPVTFPLSAGAVRIISLLVLLPLCCLLLSDFCVLVWLC